jgi:hypothetical protein
MRVDPPQISPLKVRVKGVALLAAADFLGGFLVAEIIPPALGTGYPLYLRFERRKCHYRVVFLFRRQVDIHWEVVDRLFVHNE